MRARVKICILLLTTPTRATMNDIPEVLRGLVDLAILVACIVFEQLRFPLNVQHPRPYAITATE